MKSLKLGLVAGVTALLALTACSSDHSDNGNTVGYMGAEDHSCQYATDDGSAPALQSTSYFSTYFGKTFARSNWSALASTSIRQTSQYIETYLGANVYQSANTGHHSCSPLSYLPQAYGAAMSFWNDASSGLEGSGSYILGLYLAPPQGGITKPTIMVVPDTVRWTLVHEMTHHLFETYRASQPGYVHNDQLDQQLKDSLTDAQGACPTSYDCDYNAAASKYAHLMTLLDEKLVRFTLEEMTIEANMSKSFHSGFFSYMTDESKNSIAYIVSSGKKAKDLYSKLSDAFAELQAHVNSNDLDQAVQLANNRISEIDSIISEIEALDGYPQFNLADPMASRLAGMADGIPCQHGSDDAAFEAGEKLAKIMTRK